MGSVISPSHSVEWFTPPQYLDAARAVLGGQIELDPASCAHANRTVQASRYFTKRTDGLKRDWSCKSLFLNPPYGRLFGDSGPSRQAVWTSYLLSELEAGRVLSGNAILLVNANTSEKWFQPLFNYPLCFVHHRIRYLTKSGAKDTAKKGSAFAYFGVNLDRFYDYFSDFGPIVRRMM